MMNNQKRYIKWICSALICLMLLPFAACSCSSKKQKAKNPIEVDDMTAGFVGVHNVDVRPGTTAMIENGTTTYKIVLPKKALEREMMAANELNTFFLLATGTTFEVVDDEGLAYNAADKYISIGRTALLSSAGLTPDIGVLGNSGYIIKTLGDSVFLSGAGGYGFGTIYAAYGFLTHTVNYEFYAADEIRYDTGVADLKLPIFDITDVPDFEWRVAAYSSPHYDTQIANRFRQMRRNDNSFMSNGFGSRMSHTLEEYFTKERFADHPDWFGTDGYQLCYTTRGDEEEFEAFVDAAVDYIRQILIMHPQTAIHNLGHFDRRVWCGCDACKIEQQKYGTNAAVLIKWVNQVSDKVDKMLVEEFDGRDFRLSIFAYHETENAPVKRDERGNYVKDENGNYMPADESVKLRPNVAILYAPIDAAYVLPMTHEYNTKTYETGRAWMACADNMFTWFYDTSFHNYLTPFNSWNSMQERYKYAKSIGSIWMYSQSQVAQVSPTGFNVVKTYMDSKLQWDINADFTGLLDDFFAAYYKDAAPALRKYFDELRNRFAENESLMSIENNEFKQNFNVTNIKFWPKPVLEKWLDYIDEAYEAIEPLRTTDPDLYKQLSDRVCRESITVRYLYIELYGSRYAQEDLFAMRSGFKNDCTMLGINYFNELNTISSLWSSWRV